MQSKFWPKKPDVYWWWLFLATIGPFTYFLWTLAVYLVTLPNRYASASDDAWLQSISGFLGNFVGALISGLIATGAAVFVLKRETEERNQLNAELKFKEEQEDQKAYAALSTWAHSQILSIQSLLEMLKEFQDGKLDKYGTALRGEVHSLDLVERLPQEHLKLRLGERLIGTVQPLAIAESRIKQLSTDVTTGIENVVDAKNISRKSFTEETSKIDTIAIRAKTALFNIVVATNFAPPIRDSILKAAKDAEARADLLSISARSLKPFQ